MRERGIFDKSHIRWFTLSGVRKLCEVAGLVPSTVISHIRIKDEPGAKLNHYAMQLFGRISHYYFVREFLSYQYVVRAVKIDQDRKKEL